MHIYEHHTKIHIYESLTSNLYFVNQLLFIFHTDDKQTIQLYDKRDYFNFSIVNFPHLYIATFHHHLHMVSIFCTWLDRRICKSLFYLRSFFPFEAGDWQTSWCYRGFYNLVYRTHSANYGRYNDPLCQFNLPLEKKCYEVSFTRTVWPSLTFWFDCRSCCLPDLEIGSVTGRRWMVTPPKHPGSKLAQYSSWIYQNYLFFLL
jgi:hypothetical protein